MSASVDECIEAAASPSWSLDQWLHEQRLASQMAEILQPLSWKERQAVLAEVAVLLNQRGTV